MKCAWSLTAKIILHEISLIQFILGCENKKKKLLSLKVNFENISNTGRFMKLESKSLSKSNSVQ